MPSTFAAGRPRLRLALPFLAALLVGVVAAPSPAAAATSYRLAIVLVHVGAESTPEDVAALNAVAFGPTNSVVSRYAAVGIAITGEILGPVTLPASLASSCYSGRYASAAARAAREQGISLSGYRFVAYRLFRPPDACPFNDSGYILDPVSVHTGTSSDGLTHELGHNLGFGHANGLLCTGSRDYRSRPGTKSGCISYEYRDGYSVMGLSYSVNDQEGGDGVPLDIWRASALAPAKVGSAAAIPGRGKTVALSFLDDDRGLAKRWATLALAKGWRLSIELARGRPSEWCENRSADGAGDTFRSEWSTLGCGPALVMRLLPPGKPLGFGAPRSYFIRAMRLGASFQDRKRDWSVRFSSLEDGIATVTVWDATPPGAPTGVAASLGPDGRAALSWTAPSNEVGLTYEIGAVDPLWGRTPIAVAQVADRTWSAADAWQGERYYVRALDRGGNASAWVAAPELSAPVFPDPTPQPDPAEP